MSFSLFKCHFVQLWVLNGRYSKVYDFSAGGYMYFAQNTQGWLLKQSLTNRMRF